MKAIKTKKQIIEAVNGLTDSAIVRKYYAAMSKARLVDALCLPRKRVVTIESVQKNMLDENDVNKYKYKAHIQALKAVAKRRYATSLNSLVAACELDLSPSFRDEAHDVYNLGGNVKNLSASWKFWLGDKYSSRCKYRKKEWYLEVAIPTSMRDHDFDYSFHARTITDKVTGRTWKMSGRGSSLALNEIVAK